MTASTWQRSPARALLLAAALTAGFGLAGEPGPPAVAKPSLNEVMVWRRKVLIDMQNRAHGLIGQQIADVEAWLRLYCRQRGHPPTGDEELAYAHRQLLALTSINPYLPTTTPETGAEQRYEERTPESITVKGFYGMTGDFVADLAEKAPEGWESPPGTITVLSNGRTLAVVWAADSDQKPVRDRLTNKPLIGVVRCGQN